MRSLIEVNGRGILAIFISEGMISVASFMFLTNPPAELVNIKTFIAVFLVAIALIIFLKTADKQNALQIEENKKIAPLKELLYLPNTQAPSE